MLRQMVSFPETQRAFLRQEAKRLGIPISELLRRIVDAYRTEEKAA